MQFRDENIEFGEWQRQGAMEVGARRGAHFQSFGGNHSPERTR
jgi:hypothetical protein